MPERAERIDDELAFLDARIPFAGKRILDVGCGNGAASRRLAREFGARQVIGLEVDAAQVAKSRSEGTSDHIDFAHGAAESLPFVDGAFDVVMMQKSLHHVPPGRMDQALQEAARVLDAGGTLIVSEPVAAGPFDEIMRIFHDEAEVRVLAQAALDRCVTFETREDLSVLLPFDFGSFEDFQLRLMTPQIVGHKLDYQVVADARKAYHARSVFGRLRGYRPFAIAIYRNRFPFFR
jgi:SAM-dependent methyltransferase